MNKSNDHIYIGGGGETRYEGGELDWNGANL